LSGCGKRGGMGCWNAHIFRTELMKQCSGCFKTFSTPPPHFPHPPPSAVQLSSYVCVCGNFTRDAFLSAFRQILCRVFPCFRFTSAFIFLCCSFGFTFRCCFSCFCCLLPPPTAHYHAHWNRQSSEIVEIYAYIFVWSLPTRQCLSPLSPPFSGCW